MPKRKPYKRKDRVSFSDEKVLQKNTRVESQNIEKKIESKEKRRERIIVIEM